MKEWLSDYWGIVVGVGVGLALLAAAIADASNDAPLPKTDNGTPVQTAELDGGVTCYVVRSPNGIAISCLRRPQ